MRSSNKVVQLLTVQKNKIKGTRRVRFRSRDVGGTTGESAGDSDAAVAANEARADRSEEAAKG